MKYWPNLDQGPSYEKTPKNACQTRTAAKRCGDEIRNKIGTSRQAPSLSTLRVPYGKFRTFGARTFDVSQLTLSDLWPSFFYRTTGHSATQTSQRHHSRVHQTNKKRITPHSTSLLFQISRPSLYHDSVLTDIGQIFRSLSPCSN
jgi:hypothetical protein